LDEEMKLRKEIEALREKIITEPNVEGDPRPFHLKPGFFLL
jgi:hypothetical protein